MTANPERIFQLLSDPQNKGGFACFRQKRSNLRRWFDRDWARAERKVASIPKLVGRQEAVYQARTLREDADKMMWRGTAGASDRAAYDALLEIGEQLGKLLDVGVSVRQLAERAGLGREAASNSLKRLQARGLIKKTFVGHGKAPARWNLLPSLRSISDNQPTGVPVVVGPDCPGGFASDCWRWRGLGKAKFKVWRLLGSEPVKTKDLVPSLGVGSRTVQQHLAVLEEVGLATRQADGWVKGPDTPEKVGEWLSTAGAGVRQAERHRIERQAHRDELQKFAIRENTPPLVDPETGEIFDVDELLDKRPDPSRASGVRRGTRRRSASRTGKPRRDRHSESVTGNARKGERGGREAATTSGPELHMGMVS